MIWKQPGSGSTVKGLCFLHCSDYSCQVIWVKTTVLRYGAGRTSQGQRGEVFPSADTATKTQAMANADVRKESEWLWCITLERVWEGQEGHSARLGGRGPLVVQDFLCSRNLTFYILVNKQKLHPRCLAPLIISPSNWNKCSKISASHLASQKAVTAPKPGVTKDLSCLVTLKNHSCCENMDGLVSTVRERVTFPASASRFVNMGDQSLCKKTFS